MFTLLGNPYVLGGYLNGLGQTGLVYAQISNVWNQKAALPVENTEIAWNHKKSETIIVFLIRQLEKNYKFPHTNPLPLKHGCAFALNTSYGLYCGGQIVDGTYQAKCYGYDANANTWALHSTMTLVHGLVIPMSITLL